MTTIGVANMTTVLAENENRDLFLDASGDIALYTGAEAVAQLCKSRIEAQKNSMIYAWSDGMPTAATAFNTFNPNQFSAAVRTILLATPNVTGVSNFSLYQSNGALYYSIDISTTYGTATITGGALQ